MAGRTSEKGEEEEIKSMNNEMAVSIYLSTVTLNANGKGG